MRVRKGSHVEEGESEKVFLCEGGGDSMKVFVRLCV